MDGCLPFNRGWDEAFAAEAVAVWKSGKRFYLGCIPVLLNAAILLWAPAMAKAPEREVRLPTGLLPRIPPAKDRLSKSSSSTTSSSMKRFSHPSSLMSFSSKLSSFLKKAAWFSSLTLSSTYSGDLSSFKLKITDGLIKNNLETTPLVSLKVERKTY